MAGYNYLTKEGHDKLKAELEDLKTRGRDEAARAIAEAREKGDLSENAEYDAAKKAGATGGKISGAGGGGFMIFYCPGNSNYAVKEILRSYGGDVKQYSFTKYGLTSWTV